MKAVLKIIPLVLLTNGLIATAYYEYEGQWGTYGSGNGQFDYARGITVRKNVNRGNVYVADYFNHRIQYFNKNGSFLGKWGSFGTGDNQFKRPKGVDCNWWQSDRVTVTDCGNYKIKRFTPTGSFVCKWTFLNWPNYVATAPSNGYVYVTSGYDHDVKYYTRQGSLVGSWGGLGSGNGKFNGPGGIAIRGNDNVYVVDANHRVQYFTSTGSFLGKWGSYGTGEGQFKYPGGIAVSSQHHYVFVTDSQNHRIQEFTCTGSFIQEWGSFGTGDGEFNHPDSVAVSKDEYYVYVTDSYNDRVQYFWYNPDDAADPADDFGTSTNIIPTSFGKVKAVFR